MTNLVVCCDGTWSTADENEDVKPTDTNVVKFHRALAEKDKNGTGQRPYYHPGVGTDGSWWDRIAGGGMGEGLDANIMSSYKWLAVTYRPGDAICLVGFSRGAYTVRSLAGMIASGGLLDLSDPAMAADHIWDAVDKAFKRYRKRKTIKATAKLKFHNVAPGKATAGTTPIHFLGVWDTVGALGVPDDLALLNLIDNPRKHQFHDTRLSRLVAHARHALSIDELRGSFTPTLWSNEAAHPDMTQIWFPGDHSDVGGGHAETGLSDGALKWMMDEAEKLGIAFRDVKADIKPNPRDVIHGEITGLFKALKTQPRGVPRLDKAIADKAFHASSVDRQKNPPLTGDAYWPTAAIAKGKSETRAIFAREHWNRTGIFLEAKVKYRFTATGQWLDASVKSGPQGTKDGNFQLAEVVHVAASAIGGLENVFRRMTGNKSADFWLTRREEKIPWFALVGVVANGIPADEDVPHETFEIGAGKDFTPKRGGYLYCYANDAWHAYENNRGSVQLTVERL